MLVGLVLAAVLLGLGGWAFLEQSREPTYQEKSLSHWFKEYCRTSQRMGWDPVWQQDSIAAFQHIGTNAWLYLLDQSFNFQEDSSVRTNVYSLLNDLPRSWHLPPFISSQVRRDQAPFALQGLKPPASFLIPELKRHLQATNIFERRQALFILGTAGAGASNVVPYLASALKDEDPWTRGLAVQSLKWIGPEAKAAVPALVELLQARDTNRLAYSVILALKEIGPASAPALPLIKERFERETNWQSRCALAATLCRIDSNQPQAWSFLTNGLSAHLSSSERREAAWQLGEIGPAARAAAPLLAQALEGADSTLFPTIISSLNRIGAPQDTYVPVIERQLAFAGENGRANIAASILYGAPTNHAAHLVMMRLIQESSLFSQFAIETLGRAGPAAQEAIPVLREAAKKGSRAEREAALKALARIQAEDRTSK